ncbi:hypothetical protein QTP86_013707 [Hemibagrus guttatus]|nr:hypothetical protein QTP86_013707 [Hemibagrus guttatus]
MVEELQQEDKTELKFPMKFGQQLLTMSSIMACPLKRRRTKGPAHPETEHCDINCQAFLNPHAGGRGKICSVEQEAAIVDILVANNTIRLLEIQAAVIADQGALQGDVQCNVDENPWHDHQELMD